MHVLLVDDDPDIRMIAEMTLTEIGGCSVQLAMDGPTACRLAEEGGQWDVLLLDVMMPGMDGPATLARLREIGVTAPCAYFTAWVRDKDQQDARLGSAHAVIPKPFDPDDLVDVVRSLAREHSDGGPGRTA